MLPSHYHQSDRGAIVTERDTTGTKRWGSGTAHIQRGRLLVRKSEVGFWNIKGATGTEREATGTKGEQLVYSHLGRQNQVFP